MSDEKKSICQWSKKELLALPDRKWDAESVYDNVLILSTGRKHDSGWAMMAIIGVNAGEPVEVATRFCDDIEWVLPAPVSYGEGRWKTGQFRTDCGLKSGAIQAWKRGSRFVVGISLSSITIELVQQSKETS